MHPECFICYNPLGYDPGELDAYAPSCGHVVCKPCSEKMVSTKCICPLKCHDVEPTYYPLKIKFAPDDSELNATDTLSRSLAGLEHGVSMHDVSRLKLSDEVNGVVWKVSVQTRRLIAHRQTIQRIHEQSNVLQEEILKTTEACVEQMSAIGDLWGEIYETECHLAGFSSPSAPLNAKVDGTAIPARRSRSPERANEMNADAPEAKRARKGSDL